MPWPPTPSDTGGGDKDAGGGVLLGAVLALSWCREVFLGGVFVIIEVSRYVRLVSA